MYTYHVLRWGGARLVWRCPPARLAPHYLRIPVTIHTTAHVGSCTYGVRAGSALNRRMANRLCTPYTTDPALLAGGLM